MAIPIQIPIGQAITLTSTVIYALPSRACMCTVITSTGVISVSLDNSTYQAITLDTNKNFQTAAIFIKSTTADSVICCKLA